MSVMSNSIESQYRNLFLKYHNVDENERITFMNTFSDNMSTLIQLVNSNGSYGIHVASQHGHCKIVERVS
jgi:hypothetical protein